MNCTGLNGSHVIQKGLIRLAIATRVWYSCCSENEFNSRIGELAWLDLHLCEY